MQSDSIGGNQRQSRCTQSPSEAVSLPITSTHLHDGVGQVHVGHSARKGSRGVTVSDVGNELEPELSRVERSMEGRAHLMREAIMCNHVQSCAVMCNHVQSCAIMCNQVQSCAIRCNQVQSGAIRCNHVQSCAIRGASSSARSLDGGPSPPVLASSRV